MVLRYSDFWEAQRRRLELINGCKISGKAVVVARASPTNNKKSDLEHLGRQLAYDHRIASKVRIQVVGEVAVRWPGDDPSWIKDAVEIAKAHGPDVQILAQRPSRVLRHPDFDPRKNRCVTPTAAAWQQMREILDGVELIFLMNPDATEDEESPLRSLYGQDLTGNKGGGDHKPGHEKRSRTRKLAEALADHTATGRIRPIARRYGIPRSTLYNLIQAVKAAGK